MVRVLRRALSGCRWRDRAALAGGVGDVPAAAAAVLLSLSPVLGVRAASRLLRRTAVAVLLDRVVVPRDMFVLVFFSFLLLFDQHAKSWLAALGGASARLWVKKKKRPTQLAQQTPQGPAFFAC